MPEDLRHQLEKSATKKGWSLTQELLWRLDSSYKKQRERESVRGHPVVRALGFLISELIGRVVMELGKDWHRDPFIFRAFRLGIGKLLEALEPPGDVSGPYQLGYTFDPERRLTTKEWHASFMTPEARGDFVAKEVLNELLRPNPQLEKVFRELRSHPRHGPLAEMFLDGFYGFADVRRDMGIDQLKAPTT